MAPSASGTHMWNHRRVIVVGCLVVVLSFAVLVYRSGAVVCTPSGTTTAILQLCQPASGETGWATAINNNWQILDNLFNSNGTLKTQFGGTGQTSFNPFPLIGPSSTATGSTYAHESDVTISANQNLSGVHFYRSFTLNSGATVTVPAGKWFVIIEASQSITINGTINAKGA